MGLHEDGQAGWRYEVVNIYTSVLCSCHIIQILWPIFIKNTLQRSLNSPLENMCPWIRFTAKSCGQSKNKKYLKHFYYSNLLAWSFSHLDCILIYQVKYICNVYNCSYRKVRASYICVLIQPSLYMYSGLVFIVWKMQVYVLDLLA